MLRRTLRVVVFGAVTLVVAAATAGLWWVILQETEPVLTDRSAPQSSGVQQSDLERSKSSASSEASQMSYRTSNPLFHVEPYLQYPTPTAISILWETTEPLPGEVEFGETEALGQKVIESDKPRTFHEVRLTGLKPGTLYHYRVRSGEAVSPIYTFRTAPPEGTRRWRLAVYGDSRSNPAVHRAIVEQIARKQVDLIVHTGDMVLNGKNHALWAREFFGPLTPLACRVPIIAVPGNHEGDSPYYFQYFALPGNERYYHFRYANARFICLDSNIQFASSSGSSSGTVAKTPWAKEQFAWLEKQLQELDDQTWNFVVFHQPLFSAHATRPISPLRWQWTSLLLDPKHPVDAVFNGHDHFYARTWPIASYSELPTRGVVFVTTAGGGAPLYRIRPRSYIATAVPLHHFTLLEFHDEEVTATAYSTSGQILDRFVLRKRSEPKEYFCWEVELFRENLRQALSQMPVLTVSGERSSLRGHLEVANPFRRRLRVLCRWTIPPGWRFPATETTWTLEPGQPLRIPLEAEVHEESVHLLPRLLLEFLPPAEKAGSQTEPANQSASSAGEASSAALPFRNRTVALYPFKLAGPDSYTLTRVERVDVDGKADEPVWKQTRAVRLPRLGFGSLTSASSALSDWVPGLGTGLGTGSRPGTRPLEPTASSGKDFPALLVAEAPPEVRLVASEHQLFVLVRVPDKQRRITVQPPDSTRESSALVLYDNHVRVELFDGKRISSYALSAENVPYHGVDGRMQEAAWLGVCTHDGQAWISELAIPLERNQAQSLRCNVVVYLKDGPTQYEWRAQRPALADTEWLPIWDLRGTSRPDGFAQLRWPESN